MVINIQLTAVDGCANKMKQFDSGVQQFKRSRNHLLQVCFLMWEMSDSAETKFKPSREQHEIFSLFYISCCKQYNDLDKGYQG